MLGLPEQQQLGECQGQPGKQQPVHEGQAQHEHEQDQKQEQEQEGLQEVEVCEQGEIETQASEQDCQTDAAEQGQQEIPGGRMVQEAEESEVGRKEPHVEDRQNMGQVEGSGKEKELGEFIRGEKAIYQHVAVDLASIAPDDNEGTDESSASAEDGVNADSAQEEDHEQRDQEPAPAKQDEAEDDAMHKKGLPEEPELQNQEEEQEQLDKSEHQKDEPAECSRHKDTLHSESAGGDHSEFTAGEDPVTLGEEGCCEDQKKEGPGDDAQMEIEESKLPETEGHLAQGGPDEFVQPESNEGHQEMQPTAKEDEEEGREEKEEEEEDNEKEDEVEDNTEEKAPEEKEEAEDSEEEAPEEKEEEEEKDEKEEKEEKGEEEEEECATVEQDTSEEHAKAAEEHEAQHRDEILDANVPDGSEPVAEVTPTPSPSSQPTPTDFWKTRAGRLPDLTPSPVPAPAASLGTVVEDSASKELSISVCAVHARHVSLLKRARKHEQLEPQVSRPHAPAPDLTSLWRTMSMQDVVKPLLSILPDMSVAEAKSRLRSRSRASMRVATVPAAPASSSKRASSAVGTCHGIVLSGVPCRAAGTRKPAGAQFHYCHRHMASWPVFEAAARQQQNPQTPKQARRPPRSPSGRAPVNSSPAGEPVTKRLRGTPPLADCSSPAEQEHHAGSRRSPRLAQRSTSAEDATSDAKEVPPASGSPSVGVVSGGRGRGRPKGTGAKTTRSSPSSLVKKNSAARPRKAAATSVASAAASSSAAAAAPAGGPRKAAATSVAAASSSAAAAAPGRGAEVKGGLGGMLEAMRKLPGSSSAAAAKQARPHGRGRGSWQRYA
ncbi:unnamed protein product [Polarella glacialis]|uniref:Uncharacterized protein n=1 Tax=Polarella glacialis TaxID=89957 RepID=A0A813HEM3_POLGL|nr:unnamed protein product [Polarella glacialis]